MDSGALSTLCQRYKIGTKQVIAWLAKTARDRCTPIPKPLSSKAHSQTVLFSAQDLLTLSQCIVKTVTLKKPPPSNTNDILIIISDVIRGRRECAAWLALTPAKAGKQASTASDSTHGHFIEVLRQLQRDLKLMLELTAPPRAKKTKGKKTAHTAIAKEDHIYSEKAVMSRVYCGEPVVAHDGLTMAEDTANAAEPTTSKSADHLEYGLEPQSDDRLFELWCFLEQVRQLRAHVKNLWVEVVEGKLANWIAASVTDEAFALLFYAAQELNFKIYQEVAEALELNVFTIEKEVKEFDVKELAQHIDASNKAGSAEQLLIPAYTALALYRSFLVYHETDPDLASKALHHAQQCHPLITALLEHDTQFYSLVRQKAQVFDFGKLDLFSVSVHNFLQSGVMTIAFVAQFHIYMDLYDTLGEDSFPHMTQLIARKNWVKSAISQYERLAPTVRNTELFISELQANDQRMKVINLIERGLEQAWEGDLFRPEDFEPSQRDLYLPDTMIEFPVLCGRIEANLAALIYEDGVAAFNHGRIVMAVAHLYDASRRAGLLEAKWKDMDFLIELYGKSTFGMRDLPANKSSLLSAAKQYGMALGIPPSSFDRDQSKLVYEQKVHLPSFRSITARDVGKMKATTVWQVAEEKVRKALGDAAATADNHHQRLLHAVAREILSRPGAVVDKTVREQWNACKKLTPLQLLNLLKASLVGDELIMNFKYHGFAAQCMLWLNDLMKAPAVKEALLDDYPGYQLADEMLWEGAATQRAPSGDLEKTLLGRFARMLEILLPDHGSVWIDSARSRMATQRPKSSIGRTPEAKAAVKPDSEDLAEKTGIRLSGSAIGLGPTKLTESEEASKARVKVLLKEREERKQARKAKVQKKKETAIRPQESEEGHVDGAAPE